MYLNLADAHALLAFNGSKGYCLWMASTSLVHLSFRWSNMGHGDEQEQLQLLRSSCKPA